LHLIDPLTNLYGIRRPINSRYSRQKPSQTASVDGCRTAFSLINENAVQTRQISVTEICRVYSVDGDR